MYLDTYTDRITRICKSHKVKQLFVFGSVLNDSFCENSDIDFVVDFDTKDPFEYAENYFSFKFSLEKLLNRPIDLLEERALRNRYLIQHINRTKKLIYET